MDHLRHRLSRSLTSKRMTMSGTLDMSTVEEDQEELNDTMLPTTLHQEKRETRMNKKEDAMLIPKFSMINDSFSKAAQPKSMHLSADYMRQAKSKNTSNRSSISIRSSDESSASEEECIKPPDIDITPIQKNYESQVQYGNPMLSSEQFDPLKSPDDPLKSPDDALLRSPDDDELISPDDDTLLRSHDELMSPNYLPPLDILSMIGNYSTPSSYEPLSQRFSLKVCLQVDSELVKDNDISRQGEELIISRRTLLFNSVLVQYFIRKLSVGTQMVYYVDDALHEDGPRFRNSLLSPQQLRGRAITTTASASHTNRQRFLGKMVTPPASPTSGSESTKSDKKEFISLKKMEENRNQISRQNSFSMAVEMQQQHQMESTFLRRASKRVHQLQVQQNNLQDSSSSSSDSSDSDSSASQSSASQKASLKEILPPKDQQGKSVIVRRMSTIEEEQNSSSPTRLLPLLNLSLALSTSGEVQQQSIASPTQEPIRKLTTQRSAKLSRQSSQTHNIHKVDPFVVRIKEMMIRFKTLFGLHAKKSIAFRKQRSWEDDDDRRVQLTLIGGVFILVIMMFVVIFFLAVLKYELEKL